MVTDSSFKEFAIIILRELKRISNLIIGNRMKISDRRTDFRAQQKLFYLVFFGAAAPGKNV